MKTSPLKGKRKRFSTTIPNPISMQLDTPTNSPSSTNIQQGNAPATNTPSNTIALLGSLSYGATNVTQRHLQEFVNNTESPDVDSFPLLRTPSQQRTLSPHTPSARAADINYNYSPSKTWCYCDGGGYGEMVERSNPQCSRGWFHVPCTGLSVIPEGDWYCQYCITYSN
ncbi:hypothetical protein M422DRAFT_25408 [Sphaerobolus stellatus SS14]|nr:hypothetical protein M422DRAFT_25408 [Sphaerobolus stellatus SS14]